MNDGIAVGCFNIDLTRSQFLFLCMLPHICGVAIFDMYIYYK